MSWLRVTEIARSTNLSRRYWQRRLARGEVPGARELSCGRRRVFFVAQAAFEPWWARQLRDVRTRDRASRARPTRKARAALVPRIDDSPHADAAVAADAPPSAERALLPQPAPAKRQRRSADPRQVSFAFTPKDPA